MHRSAAIQRSRLVDLNLLPAELRPHRYPGWYVLGLAAILAGCVLLVPAIVLQRSAVQETARLHDQLALITGQLQGAQVDIGRERGLRTEIAGVEQAIAALQAERASLPGAGGPLSEDLSRALQRRAAGRTHHICLQEREESHGLRRSAKRRERHRLCQGADPERLVFGRDDYSGRRRPGACDFHRPGGPVGGPWAS